MSKIIFYVCTYIYSIIILCANNSIYSHPVNCEMEEILVSLNIHTRQCVFSGNNSCGYHGICQEIHRNLLVYTACNCFEGNNFIMK